MSYFPVGGSFPFNFKPVFVNIFTVHADENWLKNERNHIQWSRDFMSEFFRLISS